MKDRPTARNPEIALLPAWVQKPTLDVCESGVENSINPDTY